MAPNDLQANAEPNGGEKTQLKRKQSYRFRKYKYWEELLRKLEERELDEDIRKLIYKKKNWEFGNKKSTTE